jgi:ABC-type thiamine transport system ATPase subunit
MDRQVSRKRPKPNKATLAARAKRRASKHERERCAIDKLLRKTAIIDSQLATLDRATRKTVMDLIIDVCTARRLVSACREFNDARNELIIRTEGLS